MVKKKDKKEKSHPRLRLFGKILGYSTAITVTIGLGGLAGAQYYIHSVTNDLEPISYNELKSEDSSNMYSKDGTLIWSSATNKRKYVKYEDLPEKYKGLLLSIEDKDYYEHEGLSYKGFANAVLSYTKSKFTGEQPRGGSTIEQQLIKLTKFSTDESDRTVDRKVKEMYLATQLYKNYSREQILEFYVNKINMGEHSYGVQTIANTYYGKPIKDLTISQQAIIAGLGQAPSTYNLYDNPEAVEQRRNLVLSEGYKEGVITKEEYETAKATPITDGLKDRYWDSTESDEISKQHNAYVNSTLEQLKSLGYDVDKSSLQVTTNLNIEDDNYLREIFNNKKEYFQNDQQQASMTVTDPKTGDVIAQLGGRYDYELSGYNRATQTSRSTGSSIKPILDYAPAVEYDNWGTNKVLDGSPYHYAGTNVTAYDYGGVTHGNSTLQVALRNSYNTPALRTLESVGESKAKATLQRFGMSLEGDLKPSYALGIDASTEQMASAFGALGNDGVYRKPRYINTITFSDGSSKKVEFETIQAVRPSTAFTLTSVLLGVPSPKGTMPNSDLTSEGIYAGVKTGTVAYDPALNMGNVASDIWTVAYTKSVSMAIWEGYDIPNEQGIDEIALYNARQEMYKDLMRYFTKGKDNTNWTKPDTVKKISGEGLDAHYVPTDEVRKDTTKNISKSQPEVLEDYSNLKSKDSSKVTKVETPDNGDDIPQGYSNGSWYDSLKEEQNKFYKDNE